MPDRTPTPASLVRRLQAGHLKNSSATARRGTEPLVTKPRRGLQPIWEERVVQCTGPRTFRVTVPVSGPLPDRDEVFALSQELRAVCTTAPDHGKGASIQTVYGHAERHTPFRSLLVLYVTVARTTGDDRSDGAYISGLVRNAIRRSSRAAEAS